MVCVQESTRHGMQGSGMRGLERPRSGRYLSASDLLNRCDAFETPTSDPLALHKYNYANANPLLFTDPTGYSGLTERLAVVGITSLVISMLLPAIGQAWNQAYHVTAQGNQENIFAAMWNGNATWNDLKRMTRGFKEGLRAGWVNDLDTLTFRQVDAIHEYRNQLWQEQGLDYSAVGSTANTFAWIGSGATWAATAVWTFGALGGGAMYVAITNQARGAAPLGIHVKYGVNGVWEHAITDGAGGYIVLNAATPGASYMTFPVPVLYPQSVLVGSNGAATAYNCVTAAVKAFGRGWGF